PTQDVGEAATTRRAGADATRVAAAGQRRPVGAARGLAAAEALERLVGEQCEHCHRHRRHAAAAAAAGGLRLAARAVLHAGKDIEQSHDVLLILTTWIDPGAATTSASPARPDRGWRRAPPACSR